MVMKILWITNYQAARAFFYLCETKSLNIGKNKMDKNCFLKKR